MTGRSIASATAIAAALALAGCGGTRTTTVTRTLEPSSTTSSATTNSQATTTSTTSTQAAATSANRTCTVTNVVNVTPSTVAVQLSAKDWPAAKSSYVNCATAKTLVGIVAGKKAQMPVKTPNFTCTPEVTGNRAAFDCSGANDTIHYRFTLAYTG